jgi:lantibiotic modifying enzyme
MVERARAAAMQVLARKAAFGGWQTGWGPRVCHEGAFQGVSGIGYALARLCAPELLPSLLDWS